MTSNGGLILVRELDEHLQGELFPRVGFIVTNLRRSAKRVVAFYNGRGTAEQWIKEGKNDPVDQHPESRRRSIRFLSKA